MSEMEQAVQEIRERVCKAAAQAGRSPDEIKIMAVTKTVEIERVNQAVACGLTLIGENKVQELLGKLPSLEGQPEIHLIGQLQTNKVKYIVDKVDMIQSVDSIKLMREIEKQAAKIERRMQVLLEVNIGREESKGGVLPEELDALLKEAAQLNYVAVEGLMAIPPMEQPEAAGAYFEKMRQLFIDIGAKKLDNVNMHVLSMGMSGDFEEAIRHGSTLVRVGTALFGRRDYAQK